MRTSTFAGIILCSASAAVAQTPTHTIETRWVAVATTPAQGAIGQQVSAGTAVNSMSNRVVINRAFRQRFELQGRVRDVANLPPREPGLAGSGVPGGSQNEGLLVLDGDVLVLSSGIPNEILTHPVTSGFTGLGRRSPFVSVANPALTQYQVNGVPSNASRIDTIRRTHAPRQGNLSFEWSWNPMTGQPDPVPTPPAPAGVNDEWASVYRVMIDVRDQDIASATGADPSYRIDFLHVDSRGLQGHQVSSPSGPPTEDTTPVTIAYTAAQMLVSSRIMLNTSFTIAITCPADFNLDESLTVQDIFDFLEAWNNNDPAADFNAADGLTVQDIFDFLAAWNTGCV
jgi:hypothetical protein